MARSRETLAATTRQTSGLVGRVVEHRDLQPVSRVVDRAGGLDDPFRHVGLVVHGQLHGDRRERLEGLGRGGLVHVATVSQKEPDDPVPVGPVGADLRSSALAAKNSAAR